MGKRVRTHRDLDVYQRAFAAAMQLFELSKRFPKEEQYSLTDQVRRSSRSVCANLSEAWRKRRYEAAFVSKLNDAEGEASETQTWIEFAYRCNYLDKAKADLLDAKYHQILAQLVRMIDDSDKWTIKSNS